MDAYACALPFYSYSFCHFNSQVLPTRCYSVNSVNIYHVSIMCQTEKLYYLSVLACTIALYCFRAGRELEEHRLPLLPACLHIVFMHFYIVKTAKIKKKNTLFLYSIYSIIPSKNYIDLIVT